MADPRIKGRLKTQVRQEVVKKTNLGVVTGVRLSWLFSG